MFSVGIVGGSGYTGAELLRLCVGHPELEVAWTTAETHAGTAVASLYPSLAAGYPDLSFVAFEPALVDAVDLVFLALPHGTSQRLVPDMLARGCRVVDLAADFRLLDAGAYERWYGEAHTCP
jgi:N-acetyl-gamma-glutamyl-phosphate reductase